LQVSSAFGRAMETVNREKISLSLYPVLQTLKTSGALDDAAIDRVIASSAEGYSFPTNLDLDPPLGGMAPKTQAQLLAESLEHGIDADAFAALLAKQSAKRLS